MAPGARWVMREWNQGLQMVLHRDGHLWRLALGRARRQPSEDEIETCRQMFEVPTGTEVAPVAMGRRNIVAVEMRWREAESALEERAR